MSAQQGVAGALATGRRRTEHVLLQVQNEHRAAHGSSAGCKSHITLRSTVYVAIAARM
jgi:hypothetical protein